MGAKKKQSIIRLVAVILSVMLLVYNMPIWVFSIVNAAGEESNDAVFTLQVVNGDNPVIGAEVTVTAESDDERVEETKETNGQGEVYFPEITNAPFEGEFHFFVKVGTEEKTFTLNLGQGSKGYYIYDVQTGSVIPKEEQPEPTPEPVETVEVTVNIMGNGKVIVGDVEYSGEPIPVEKSKEVELTFIPDQYYGLQSVKNGEDEIKPIKNEDSNTYKATLEVDKDITLDVAFVKEKHVILLVDQVGEGTVKIDNKPLKIKDPLVVKDGADVKLEVTPSKGYEIKSVTINDETIKEFSDKQKYTKTIKSINEDIEIQVEFILKKYTISFKSYQNGTIKAGNGDDIVDQEIDSSGGSIKVVHGQKNAYFEVKPNEGYHVSNIKINGKDINLKKDLKDNKYTFPEIDKDYEVEVTFSINTYKVEASVVEGNGTIALEYNGKRGNPFEVDYGSDVKVYITPDDLEQIASLKINDEEFTFEDINDDETFKEEEGSVTFTLEKIIVETTIDVTFENVPIEDGKWADYLKIELTSGSKIEKPFVEGNEDKEVLVFSKDAELKLSSNLESYKLIGYKSDGKYKPLKPVKENIKIDSLVFKKFLWKKKIIDLQNSFLLLFDKEKPVIENIKLEGENEVNIDGNVWYQNAVTVSGNVTDVSETFEGVSYSSGIQHVYYQKEGTDEKVKVENFNSETNEFSFVIDTEDGTIHQGTYKIWAVDEAGNESDPVTVFVNIDKVSPTLIEGKSAVTFEKINDEHWKQFLNFLTFGTFFNEEIKVTIKAQDEGSGIKSIQLLTKDEKVKPKLVEKESDFTNGKAVFTLDDDDFTGPLYVKITDNVLNENVIEVDKTNSNIISDNNEIKFDKKEPIIGNEPDYGIHINAGEDVVFYDDGDNVYYSDDVEFEVVVTDPDSGINQVVNTLNGEEVTKEDYSQEKEGKFDPITFTYHTADYTENMNEDGSYELSTWVMDNAGNENGASKKIYIDKSAPTLSGEVTITTKVHDEWWAKFINFLSFGTFFNNEVIFEVKVEDDISGIKDIVLTSTDKNVPLLAPASIDREKGTATFKLDVDEFKGTFSVVVTDNVDNKETYELTKENSNIVSENNEIVVEKNKPDVKIEVIPDENVSSNGDNVYNGDVTFDVTVEDTESGINSVAINVNGKKYTYDYSEELVKRDQPITYSLHTKDNPINIDGSYNVSVEVFDNAGNKNMATKTIYIDRSHPMITNFSFSTSDTNYEVSKDLSEVAVLTKYGYYFNKPTRVTITAVDPKVDYEFTSKVKSMTIYLKDYENGKHYAVQPNGSLKEISVSEIGLITPVPTDAKVTFNMPESFKGQIFVRATDHVNNTGAFETPDGKILEPPKLHAKETHIKLEKPETPYKDNNNVDLYAGNVNIDLTVIDTYSGISEIEWSVVAPYDTKNNQSGKLKINNDRTYAPGSNTEGWKQTRTDKNLVTEMKKTLTVTNDSNNIKVKVKMKDRAGNTSEDEIVFSIDKTAPTIEVTYDNNTADPVYTDYFNADRTATIVITERNFKPEDVEYKITNTDGVIPKLSGWRTVRNTADPNKTQHIATIHYSADGDYTFDIKYKDNANHAAAPYQQDKFTIDKTKPVISISYDNNAAANGNFYNADRTATISITEHNFDPSRVEVTGTATHEGESIPFPSLSGWSSNGDIHTATITYSADGNYTFDIDFTDMAGNVMDDYPMEEFVVDQTAPIIEIEGVEDQSANNGDVAPVISFSDTNFNRDTVSITLEGANRGSVELDGEYREAENGGVFLFRNFAKEKEVDDLYTLTATLEDQAGNQTTETIRFSVNRFGSVYVFDESLESIRGKYVQKERDVIVTEINVDQLDPDSISIKVTKNGTPSDLTAGEDYSVKESGGDGSWSSYTYTVKKELFAGDGRYSVALYSEDRAGNINENIDETKQAEISFGIDKTAPVIVPIDLEDGVQYPVDKKVATVSITDNLLLEEVKIFLNDKNIDYENDDEIYSFEIGNSTSKQGVKIVAVDAAGNEVEVEVAGFLVTTNLIARWVNNTPLFYGSIGGIGAVATAGATYYFLRKRKLSIGFKGTDDPPIEG